MSLLRFLGIGKSARGRESEPESLTEISAQLDALPPDEARFVAAFSYLLARIAGADLRTGDAERNTVAKRLETYAGVDADRARLLAATAIDSAATHGASDHHLVTRAFRDLSEPADRIRLLRCLYAVAAADENVSSVEDNEIFEVATALGVSRADVVGLRSEVKEHLGSMKPHPRER